ncbi:tetratricopeptide repeat protein [Nonomuraea angiospora]|uniref:Tetratricopeptide (TPR) repeat protein n=1 Tax=Nonomuraea angiospora TaxID=46172 RepID=A0ABR9LUH0_9ACTN|nr:tetratricopeptide repeat protein [Nonomuraea angiospora]MBE1583945.1 tetratricopeptide (TPR) repeat protein [Nonomuraea angiospora]
MDFPWTLGADEEGLQLLDSLMTAPKGLAGRHLAQIEERAATGDRDARNLHAVALAATGRLGQAVDRLRAVVADHPELIPAWVNLCRCHLELRQPYMALTVLEEALEHAQEPHEHEFVQHRLWELREWAETRREQARLVTLRAAMLRERVERGLAGPGDRRRLGAALLELVSADHEGSATAREAADVLRQACDVDGDDAATLELLVRAVWQDRDHEALREALHRLERVAPHSRLLEAMRPPDEESAAEQYELWKQHVTRLTEDAMGQGPQADAARDDLRTFARAFPKILSYRNALLAVAIAREDWAEGVALADALVADSDTHDTHFNVAQVYWHNGEYGRANDHLVRAIELAENDEEAQDAMRMILFLHEQFGPERKGRRRWVRARSGSSDGSLRRRRWRRRSGS